MTDFVRDLELELLAAARRRAARRRRPRGPRRPALVLAAVAAALAAVVLVPRPAPDDRPVAAPPGGFAPPLAAVATPCMDAQPGTPAPDSVFADIELLRRSPTAADRLPKLGDVPPDSWLPVGAYVPGSERKPGRTQRLTVVPTADVRTGRADCEDGESAGPGACVVDGITGEPIRVHCFTLAEIRAGRAFALMDDARLAGLAPDGVPELDVTLEEKTVRVPVHDNVAQLQVPGLRPGEPIRVRFAHDVTRVRIVHHPTLTREAERIALRLRKRGLEAPLGDEARTLPNGVSVQALRPGSGPLAREVGALIGADRVNPNPPRHAKLNPGTPEVLVLVGPN